MCSCWVEKFHSEGNEYVKKLTHFHCKCKQKHLLYVLLCNKHPYGAGFIPQMEKKKCTCATAFALDICDFCVQVKYLLNFKSYKILLKRIPVSIQDELQKTCQYFKVMKSFQPFFTFNKERNRIDVLLENPAEPNILAKTDYVFSL